MKRSHIMNIHFNSAPGIRVSACPGLQPNQEWQANGSGSSTDRPDWTALECLRTLYRRKAALLYVTSASIIAVAAISLTQPRWYQSEASLEIQAVNENFLNARDIYPTVASGTDASGIYVQTQAELLQQDALIEQVVNKLHLEARPEFQVRPNFWSKLHGLTLPDSSPAQNARNVAEIVKRHVKIISSPHSRILRIFSEARDPKVAADLANALAQTFIEYNIDVRRQAAQQTYVSLSLPLEELRTKLLSSQAALAAEDSPHGSTFSSPRHVTWFEGWSRSTKWKEQEVEADRRFYEAMSQRVDEARIAASVRQSNIRLVGTAQPAARPYKPNLPLNLAAAVLGGLILATGWVLIKEQTNSFFRTPGEAGTFLPLPELGVIPQMPGRMLMKRCLPSSRDAILGVQPIGTEQQDSELSESFRATLASILSVGRNGEQQQVFVVTSAQPTEGKTTVVSNLAIGLSEIGSKVLVIDGDMRRPRLHNVFDLANSWGLSDVLREKNAVEDLPLGALVKKTKYPGLSLLPSGVAVDNVFGLLWSGRMQRLLPRFRKEFDFVLLDAPPCLEFADARIMARHADQLLLVVRANHTDIRTVQVAVQRLLRDGISVMGFILNRCDLAQSDANRYAFQYSLSRQGNA